MTLQGRTAVVTGASSGIGRALAISLARRGVRVALLARDASALEAAARDCGELARAFPCDVSDPAQVEAAAAAVLAAFGPPDLLVNNAGAGRFLAIEETAPEEAASMMAVPYLAAFYVTRAFLPAMKKRGSGRVLTVTSPSAFAAMPRMAGYTAARWAMRGLHEALRAELHGTGVSATLVVPGKVSSAYFERNPGSEERLPALASLIPTLTPEDVGETVARALERRCVPSTLMFPFMLRAFHRLHAWAPRLVERLLWR